MKTCVTILHYCQTPNLLSELMTGNQLMNPGFHSCQLFGDRFEIYMKDIAPNDRLFLCRYYNWQIAAPMLMSHVIFQRPLRQVMISSIVSSYFCFATRNQSSLVFYLYLVLQGKTFFFTGHFPVPGETAYAEKGWCWMYLKWSFHNIHMATFFLSCI